jgi:hypothetical protein
MATELNLTRQERGSQKQWFFLTAFLNAELWAVALTLGVSGSLLGGLALLTAGSLGLLGRAWRGRRVAVRVDEVGVHEIFATGREITHVWEDLRDATPPGEERAFTFRADRRRLRLGPCLADFWSLASVIRARLRGEPLEPFTDRWQPTAEQLAEWLEVQPDKQLPVTFWSVWSGCFWLVWLMSGNIGAIELKHALERLFPSTFWGEMLSGVVAVTVMVGVMLALPLIARPLGGEAITVSINGIEVVSGRGRRFCAWEDLLSLSGNELRTRQGTIRLARHFYGIKRLRRALQRALEARGPVPEVSLPPAQVPTAASLSRARRPEGEVASQRALSRAAPPMETKERLAGEVMEETREVTVQLSGE